MEENHEFNELFEPDRNNNNKNPNIYQYAATTRNILKYFLNKLSLVVSSGVYMFNLLF